MPGTTVRISEDGEVLARGIGVFRGYRNPANDAEAFVDGFFRTGDLGSLDEDGHLTLHGRQHVDGRSHIHSSHTAGRTQVDRASDQRHEGASLASRPCNGETHFATGQISDPAHWIHGFVSRSGSHQHLLTGQNLRSKERLQFV
jgi:hypothetical protein